MLRRALPLAIFFTVLVSFAFVAWAYTRDTAPPMPPLTENAALITYWQDQITQHNPARAYQELLAAAAPLSMNDQHLLGHIFGRALYATEGIDGFTVCGLELTDGCHHEFIARSIRDHGEIAFEKLGAACHNSFSTLDAIGCEHGLGHGLIMWLGYNTAELQEALAHCSSITSLSQTKGCMGGVFMEHNLRTSEQGTIRPDTMNEHYTPCTDLPSTYQAACYFWLPQWWMSAHFSDAENRSPAAFRAVGEYCAAAPAHQESCFAGIGYLAAPTAQYQENMVGILCKEAALAQEGTKLFAACHTQATESTSAD